MIFGQILIFLYILSKSNMSSELIEFIEFRFDEVLNQNLFSSSFRYSSNDILLNIKDDNLNCSVQPNTFDAKLLTNKFTDNENIIIICTKDNAKLLNHTLNKLISYKTQDFCDILIVDDRSETREVEEVSTKYNTSYLKVINSLDMFNYSVLNNIAACYAKVLNKKNIIFYNNDVWPDNQNTIINLINKHNEYKSDISGCRLLYPSKEDYNQLTNNIHRLLDQLDRIVGTIQHGGIYFSPIGRTLKPFHLWRFHQKNKDLASYDSMCYAVTGAFQIVNTNSFFNIKGFNEGMSCAFQDIDLCVKALSQQMKIYYFGSEYLYHIESPTIAIENISSKPQLLSDNILWNYLWTQKLPILLGHEHG